VLLGVAALLAPVALGAAVGSAHALAPPVTWTVLVGNQAHHKAIQGQRFLPGDITIDEGDSVTWKANGAEIHTVTFFDGGTPQATLDPLDPTDPDQVTRQGPVSDPTVMDGSSYYNSGLLTTMDGFAPIPVPVFHKYTLTFPDAGTYSYYCLVHGVMMRGVVHVQTAGAPYPATQEQIDADAAWLAGAIVADGRAQWDQLKAASRPHKVFMGYDNGVSMLMRFVHARVVIHKGDRVRFLNTMSMGAPHTITFGKVPSGLALFSPSGDPTNYRGGKLHSGILPPGTRFNVTFNKVGKFHFVCALHRDMGMKGVVVVKR
jgi:plastocyanin